MKTFTALFVAKAITFLTRTLKIGGGSAAPGYYALKIDPNLVSKLSDQIPQNIVITGTNGKTTTARLLSHFIKTQKIPTLRNSTGSNLERGVASALISASDIFGNIKGIQIGVWEVDEAAFNTLAEKLKPQTIVILNAFRDQLDRYGEVDTVIKKWIKTFEKVDWNPTLFINASDPNLLPLLNTKNVYIQKIGVTNVSLQWEKNASNAHQELDFNAVLQKNNGLSGTEFALTYNGSETKVLLPIPGVYHIFDFLAAFCVYYNLNLPVNDALLSLPSYKAAFGRVEKIQIKDHEGYIFLIKNPAGATNVFETLSPEITEKDSVFIALNDNFADGTDVSWIWDAKFEELIKNSPKTSYIVSGKRAYDLALRLKYAGVIESTITLETNIAKALEISIKKSNNKLFILPTYTALLELQKILAEKGYKKHYWKEN